MQAQRLMDDMIAQARSSGRFRLRQSREFVDLSYFQGPVGVRLHDASSERPVHALHTRTGNAMTDMTDTNTTESTTRKDNMTADHINHADRTDNGEHAIIAVEHVTLRLQEETDRVGGHRLHRAARQSLAILGYNGVGKTTLFRLIVGLLRPREGRCVIDRRRVPSMRACSR